MKRSSCLSACVVLGLSVSTASVAFADPPTKDTKPALVAQAKPGDVVGLMCHEDRQGVYDWLAGHGFTVDTPEVLREKVRAAAGG